MAQSEVFEKMLTSSMEEAKTNEIKIFGVQPNIMEAFIKYLHLGQLNDLDSVAQDLFVVADKYRVETLMVKY